MIGVTIGFGMSLLPGQGSSEISIGRTGDIILLSTNAFNWSTGFEKVNVDIKVDTLLLLAQLPRVL